jgi:hypothetical protein
MNIELTDQEKDILRRALEWYLGDLREEIVKTEKHDMKVTLHTEEDVIKETIKKLA